MKYKGTFQQFATDVNVIMKKMYGLDPGDFDSPSEAMLSDFEAGLSPKKFCDWYAEKCDLVVLNCNISVIDFVSDL